MITSSHSGSNILKFVNFIIIECVTAWAQINCTIFSLIKGFYVFWLSMLLNLILCFYLNVFLQVLVTWWSFFHSVIEFTWSFVNILWLFTFFKVVILVVHVTCLTVTAAHHLITVTVCNLTRCFIKGWWLISYNITWSWFCCHRERRLRFSFINNLV